ncbi:M50 family metallopeptidase [Actinoplanes utahensis]|uniref:M50 family peptidase n=1 Tax=Actinoplanes utahensis TaxID=1869 RepID=A0A0A6UHF2_ACTUT|nr:M50 family metallopeptidase [Actinoplanes utahensis]KHD74851.1 hypothetical protein MB27_26330 [Actinoplanes utahensis]GIF30774.1 membrane protein [Actinoplanes utahensis]
MPRLVWTAALLSWVLAVPLWFVMRFVLVIAHEGGHALASKLLFRNLESVTFNRSGGGMTSTVPPVPWLFNILIKLAGYLGPSLFGLFGVWLLVRGSIEVVLWGSLAFLAVMLFAVRGVVGWLSVPGLMVIIWLIATRTEPPLQTLYTHMWIWFLLIGAVQRMLLFVANKQYDQDKTDAAGLESLTGVPSAIWTFVFLVGTIAALAYGGGLLLRSAM